MENGKVSLCSPRPGLPMQQDEEVMRWETAEVVEWTILLQTAILYISGKFNLIWITQASLMLSSKQGWPWQYLDGKDPNNISVMMQAMANHH